MSKVSDKTNKKGKYLQAARFRRLNLIVQSKALDLSESESGDYQTLFDPSIRLQDMQQSGLSSYEMKIITDWYDNQLTGHQSMVAIMNHRFHQQISSQTTPSVTTPYKNIKPIDLLSLSLSFPMNYSTFMTKSIYMNVFAKTPKQVVKEALEMVREKSCEKSLRSLSIEQLNLALKQIRLDSLKMYSRNHDKENVPVTDSPSKSHSSNNDAERKAETVSDTSSKEDEELKVQVLIELIRLFLKSDLSKTSPLSQNSSKSSPKHPWDWTTADVYESLSSPSVTVSSTVSFHMDTAVLETHLTTPLPTVQEQSINLSLEDLESSNTVFKPYLRHLANLKGILAVQLKDLEDSKAYLALGVSQDSNESTLKKAYRNMAIKLHPDKPGGDTAKFQQLQDFYHEIVKRREENHLVHERLEQQKLDPKHTEMIDRSHGLLEKLWTFLQEIQSIASNATKITQKHMKFVKKIKEKCLNKSKKENASISVVNEQIRMYCLTHRSKSNTIAAMISYCEKLCDVAQQMSTLAMTLPSISPRYGNLIAKYSNLFLHRHDQENNHQNIESKGYLKDIESCMGLSLEVLRGITDLMSSDHRVNNFLSSPLSAASIYGPSYQRTSQEYLHHIVESYQDQQVMIHKISNNIMNCALYGGHIYSFIERVIQNIDENLLDEVKRNIRQEQDFQGYSEEDKDVLRKHAAQAFTSATSPSTNASNEKTKESTDICESNDDNDEEKDHDKDEEEGKEDSDEKSSKKQDESMKKQHEQVSSELNELRSRIHSLQVKLHVQNIQIFQVLNNEVRDLQHQLQAEVLSVMVIDTPTTTTNNSIASNDPKAMNSMASHTMSEYLSNLLALLAECVDGSLSNLRDDIEKYLQMDLTNRDDLNQSKERYFNELIRILQNHIGWMLDLQGTSTLNQSSLFSNSEIETYYESLESKGQTASETSEMSQSNGLDEKKKQTDGSDETNQEKQTKLIALLPDYRSKTLWLVSLIDKVTIETLINEEMSNRIRDLLQPLTNRFLMDIDAKKTIPIVLDADIVAKRFCGLVLKGIRLVSVTTTKK